MVLSLYDLNSRWVVKQKYSNCQWTWTPLLDPRVLCNYASFGSVCSYILDLSVYSGETGSSLIVYTKFERVSLNDRQTDGQTDIQTDRCLADIYTSLHIPKLFDNLISIKI